MLHTWATDTADETVDEELIQAGFKFVRDGYYGHTTKLDIAYVFNVRRTIPREGNAPH